MESNNLDWSHQKDIAELIDIDIKNNIKCVVAALCCGAGKSTMIYNMPRDYANYSFLIIAHGTTILKDNLIEEFSEWKEREIELGRVVDFEPSTDIKSNSRVVVTLPQSIHKKDLRHFDFILFDEGHEFFFASMDQKIINKINPKHIIVFTASPENFILKNQQTPDGEENPYKIHFLPLLTLYNQGYLSKVGFEIASTSLNLHTADFSQQDELIDSVTTSISTRSQIETNLNEILDCILNKLQHMYRTDPEKYNKLQGTFIRKKLLNKASEIFCALDKTMIVAPSINYANLLFDILKDKIGVDKIGISHSEKEDGDDVTKEFKTDNKIVLIVVRRGILGYNNKNLMNVVDLSFSKNPSRLYQLFCRLVRKKENNNKEKLYFKVVPNNLNVLYTMVVNAALCLCHEDWLRRYNGKNFNEMNIPIFKKGLENLKKSKERDKKTVSNEHKPNKNIHVIDSLELLQDVLHEDGSVLNTYATIKLSEVEYLMGFKSYLCWDKKIAIEEIKKYKTRKDLMKSNKGVYGWLLNNYPDVLDEYFENFHWNYDEVINEMKKYKTRTEFYKNNRNAYNWIFLNYKDILDKNYGDAFWNKISAINEMKKYKTRQDFIKKCKGAYSWLTKNNFKNEIEKYFPKLIKNWNYDEVINEMKKYKTRQDFSRNSKKSYKWMITYHRSDLNNFFGKTFIRTKEFMFNEIKKYNTKKDFIKNDISGYYWILRSGYKNEMDDYFEKLK